MAELNSETFMSETGKEAELVIETLQSTPKDSKEYSNAANSLKELTIARSTETRRVLDMQEAVSRMENARREAQEAQKINPNTVITVGGGLLATLALIAFEAFGNGIVTSKAPDIVGKLFRR